MALQRLTTSSPAQGGGDAFAISAKARAPLRPVKRQVMKRRVKQNGGQDADIVM